MATPTQHPDAAAHYTAMAAQAEAEAHERAALTDAIDAVKTFLGYARDDYYEMGVSPEASAINHLISAVRYLSVAVDNLSDRLRAIEDEGTR